VRRIRHRIGVAWGIIAILVMAVGPALAGGISVLPGAIDVNDALRGSTIFRDATLTNTTGVATPFDVTFDGEAGAWMKLVDPEDRTTEITQVLDADGSGTALLIRIDVPTDIANRAYQGILNAVLAPPENSDEGLSVGLGVLVPITLEVSGDQVIAAILEDLSILDTEVGVPARIVASINNTGNIQVIPEFTLEILRDGATISTTTSASQPSFPGEQSNFEVRWDTTSAEPGTYTARVSIDFEGVDLGTTDLDFVVHPVGSLSRFVTFTSLETSGEAWAGGLAGFTATVDNPGQVDTSATITGELTKNGAVVGTYESAPFLVKAGEQLSIPINIEVPDEGDFVFTARVVFGDGETTEPLTVEFATVVPGSTAVTEESGEEAGGGGVPLGAVIAGVAVFVMLIGVGAWLVARKRDGGDSSEEAVVDDGVDPDKQAATVGSED